MRDKHKTETLKDLILALHAGEDFAVVKAGFDQLIKDVSPEELTVMEQQLIQEGLPVEEVQRLCDLHVGVVREGLAAPGVPEVTVGHPVHTYMQENREFERLANRLLAIAKSEQVADKAGDIAENLALLAKVDTHYLRKENQLFPYLEKHGVTGPTQVMWGIHDEIRTQLRALQQQTLGGIPDAVLPGIVTVAHAITEMIYKEEKILFPMALSKLSDVEWIEMRRGESEIGYAFEEPPAWPSGTEAMTTPAQRGNAGMLQLSTGQLTNEQLNRMLTRLPMDISFVDADDRVQFYSDNPNRIFPRTPAVIGRSVSNCHPPKSVSKVEQILEAFKDGTRDEARFWIQLDGRFILIQYFAVRSTVGKYLGCLEASQDVTEIRRLEGEKRLLDRD